MHKPLSKIIACKETIVGLRPILTTNACMKSLILFCLLFPLFVFAQSPDNIFLPNIHTVKLFKANQQLSIPLISLNSGEQLELHFDDLDDNIKNYYYTFVLCNADWQPANLSGFDYIKGFQQQRIGDYQVSSISQVKYIHYQTLFPTDQCVPSKSGNYLLKVFLDSDTSKVAFTKRFFIVNNKVGISGRILQPYDNSLALTHQKLQFTIDVGQLNVPNPVQQVKVVAVQNFKWDEGRYNLQPAFIRGNYIEYDGERDCIFEASKEYRFLDLTSFRFYSYWVDKINKDILPNLVYLKVDGNRLKQQYAFYVNYYGWLNIGSTEVPNGWWQTDYANVLFSYYPTDGKPLSGKNIYLTGELTQNHFDDSSKMKFNPYRGVYEKTLLLKQGIYSYNYTTKEKNNPDAPSSFASTEGNYWETDNDYEVLVYYHSYSSRSDELVGFASLNSKTAFGGN